MGKVIRRSIAILLCATAVLLAVLPQGSVEATSTHGDYEYDGATVAKYLGSDREVTVPAWVNRVGKEAFEGYDKMTKLVLPDSVTTVDFGAFSNCGNLQTVKMSESVRTLGSSAFSGCTDLYSVSIPRTVRTIGSGTFAGCPSLASVPVAENNKNYTSYDGVIYSKDGKKLVQYLAGRPKATYEMPLSVKEIEEYAFWGANNLEKLSITSGVNKIPEYAFANCKGLQHVTLPRSVQSIFAYAFQNCDSLSYINIPDSVGYIDDRAFSNTNGAKLRFIDPEGNVVKTFNSEDVDDYGSGTGGVAAIEKPDYSMDKLGDTGRTEDNGSTDKTSENGNTDKTAESGSTDKTAESGSTDKTAENGSIDKTTENGNTDKTNDNGSTDKTEENGNPGSMVNEDGSTIYYEDGDGNDTASADSYGDTFDPTDVTPLEGEGGSGSDTPQEEQTAAPDNILTENSRYNDGYYKPSDSGTQPWDTKIEYHDYEDNMTGYDLGGGKILGGVAVLRMSSDIPVKGFDLGGAEFEDDYIGTAGMNPIEREEDVIGDVYAAYSGDADTVSVPAGVTTIGNRAFYENEDLKSIELPSSITDIGEFAFARSGLTSVTLPEGTKNIDYAAFYMCDDLADVNIPSSVEKVALGAFEGTPYLENLKSSAPDDFVTAGDGILLAYKGHDQQVVIPDNVKHIGPGAFAKNNSIKSVVIPGSVRDIGEEAFCDCPNLKELVMDEGVTEIEDRAFKNSALKAVNIPDSVERIGLSAFDNGGTLKTVIINGNNVPNVTYNKSATRLSAKKLRTDAFEGAENAIVSRSCDIDSGTLFDPRYYGFHGEVYSVNPDTDKTLVLERALIKPDMAGNVLINQDVMIAGDKYTLGQVKSDAFDNYKNWSELYDNKPATVAVNGERSEELNELLAGVNSGVIAEEENDGAGEDETDGALNDEPDDQIRSNITVSVNGKRFPTRGSAKATIPNDNDRYKISITEDETAKDRIDAAFLHSYGTTPAGGYVPLSVDMYDKSGTVPIHKLGNSKMEMSIPVPTDMENDEGVGVAYLDDNGILTNLSSDIEDDGNGKMLNFVTGHCSTYVIYSRTKPSQVPLGIEETIIYTEGDAAAGSALSGTWQSLNKKVYGPVSAKWFIIVILTAMAGILVLFDSGKKKNVNKSKNRKV
ncbi:MAG: leucine-rich repeat protein [Lachnospiraceae bacterium]|nr:leucine-rich repeat protein [Lachnospiraceae bacterium]